MTHAAWDQREGFVGTVMNKSHAVAAMAALAQESRFEVYRTLAAAGPDGLTAGAVAGAVKLAPNALTFHLDRLRDVGLIAVRRNGRSMIYTARREMLRTLLDYLSRNCQ